MVVAYTWTLHNRGPTVSPIWASQQVHMIHTSLPVLCEARSRELRFASPGMVQTDGVLFCFSYTGKRSSTNMVIIDVKMLSGFLPVKSSLDKVNYRNKIKWVTPGTKEKTGLNENKDLVNNHSSTSLVSCLHGCTVFITGMPYGELWACRLSCAKNLEGFLL